MLNATAITLTRGSNKILSDLSFALPQGALCLITGKNGTGKTTLLRACAGLLPISQGTLTRKNNESPLFISAQELPADTTTPHDYLTLHANLSNTPYPLLSHDPFGISPHLHTPFKHLSTGQRQRIKLSRLNTPPHKIWLLDEPTSGLDKTAQATLNTIINQHLKTGGCALIATHQPDLWPHAQILDIQGTP